MLTSLVISFNLGCVALNGYLLYHYGFHFLPFIFVVFNSACVGWYVALEVAGQVLRRYLK